MESVTKNKQTKENIIKMVKRAFTEEAEDQISIIELTEGFFNVAYEIGLPNKKVIMKIAPSIHTKVMSYEQNIMMAEVEGLRFIKANTSVPVPEVIFYDVTKELCDAEYFIMEKLEGESFSKLRNSGMPESMQANIQKEIGRLNREMNQCIGSKFGYLGQPSKQSDNWKQTFLIMISDILAEGELVGSTLGVDYDQVRTVIEKASFCLEEVTIPAFVHWDLWEGNILVKDGVITGVIDFERALWGDPLMEYSFRKHSYNKDFIQGYGEDLRAKAPIRAILYDIYLYLILIVETTFRKYDNDWLFQFGTKGLAEAMEELERLLS